MKSKSNKRVRIPDWDCFLLQRDLPGLSSSVAKARAVARAIVPGPPKVNLHRKWGIRRPGAILEYMKSLLVSPECLAHSNELLEQFPILQAKHRYRDNGGTWRLITVLDVFLLLRAGFEHREIASYLNTQRYAIKRLAHKLRKAGLSISRAQKPETAKRRGAVTPRANIYQCRITEFQELYRQGKISHHKLASGVLLEQEKEWDNYERQWRRNGVLTFGVGPELERFLDTALSYNSRIGGGKRVTRNLSSSSGLEEDSFSASSGKGDRALLDYWGSKHLGSWQFDHELYLRLEHDRQMVQQSGAGCSSCKAWLRTPRNRAGYNNPSVSNTELQHPTAAGSKSFWSDNVRHNRYD